MRLSPPKASAAKRWLVSGNEMTGLGAIRGGVRFAAAYPITPASEILEWLAPSFTKVGGVLLQAEDELAAINMIIGASFGGTPALTATSGPGLSLMVEALGLATAAEIPVVVVDVMRAGPSTGIPTKSEQADLNIAVYGCHGDAPHLVLAPQSVTDCLLTTQWAVHLAEALQAPAIVLSDQSIGQTVAAIERPADVAFIGQRAKAVEKGGAYKRYAVTANGVSPMAIPGLRGGQYTADGLTHTERGTPTSSEDDHRAQLDKRRAKLDQFTYGDHWATVEGDGEFAVITWGSLTGAAREAVRRVARPDRHPPGRSALTAADPARATRGCARRRQAHPCRRATHGAQFHRYLRAHYDLPGEVRVLNRPGPLPITAGRNRASNHGMEVLMANVETRLACKPADYKSDIKPIWCPGCGDYHVLMSFNRAFAELGLGAGKYRRRVRYRLLVAHSGLYQLLRLPWRARPFAGARRRTESGAA